MGSAESVSSARQATQGAAYLLLHDQPKQRRTVGFFVEKKFGSETVIERLKDYGFQDGKYARVIVTWGWDAAAQAQAQDAGIELWDFRTIIHEVAEQIRGSRQYYSDDTLRTLILPSAISSA